MTNSVVPLRYWLQGDFIVSVLYKFYINNENLK